MNIIFTPIIATTRYLQKCMIFLWKQFHSCCHKNALFCTIFVWVFLAAVAYTALNGIWENYDLSSGWSLRKDDSTQLERIKTSLTIIGGIGAIGYLVIKFRERSALERSEADEKLIRAVQQLGDTSPQVRIAGVYALADVADTYEGPYHQRVVDILCGYLRTDRLLKDANGNTQYATNEDGSPNYSLPLSADAPIESTILSVLGSHLRSSATAEANHQSRGPWSFCTLDIHGAHITEHVNFDYVQLGEIDARGTQFIQGASFTQTKFANRARFDNSTFTQIAVFYKSEFENDVSFQYVTFKEKTDFSAVRFTKTPRLFEVTFNNSVTFEDATFMKAVNFCNTHLKGSSTFINCTFQGDAEFTATTFRQNADFRNASFALNAYFDGVKFIGYVDFSECEFKDAADFTSSNFSSDTLFERTSFGLDVSFMATSFMSRLSFDNARFTYSLKGTHRVILPAQIHLNNDGLPTGAEWSEAQI